MKRVGMAALAKAAGVSVATVDRVLNGREPVREDTRALITEAALRIGHPAAQRLAPGTEARPRVRLGVVLHKQGQEFYKAFAEALHLAVAQAQGVQAELVLEFSANQSPSEMATKLRSMAGRCDVLAATSVNHPEVTAAVEDLRDGGLAVFSLLSDFAQGARAGYVGLNNLKVGRTAGWFLSLAAQEPGAMAIFVGGHRWHGHELRETGFRSYMRECAPQLSVLEPLINLETRQLTYDATLTLLRQQPKLRGIYVAGGGMEGAIAALRATGRGHDVALVVSALTPESRAGLAEGLVTTVIDTPLEKLCRDLIVLLTRTALTGMPEGATQRFLAPDFHLAESI